MLVLAKRLAIRALTTLIFLDQIPEVLTATCSKQVESAKFKIVNCCNSTSLFMRFVINCPHE